MDDMVYSVSIAPNGSPARRLLAAKASGLWISRDGGQAWEDAYAGLGLTAPLPTMVLAVEQGSPDEGARIYAGVPGGVLSSQDGGATWQVSRLPEPPPVVSCLAVSPDVHQDGVILAGTVEDGVFRSVDRARTWTRWNFGLLDLNILALAISPDFAQDETLFAGAETGIFRSTNGGRAWREVDFPIDLAPVLSLAISPRYTQNGQLFAGTEANGLYLSNDRGKTWQPAGELFAGTTVNAILVNAADPAALRLLALADDRLLVSRDGGQSWTEWESPAVPDGSISCMAAPNGLAQGALLLVGTIDGQILWI